MHIEQLTESIIQMTTDGKQLVLFELDQRTFVKWIWENRPDIIRDIACEGCPEHGEAEDYQNYCLNKAENK